MGGAKRGLDGWGLRGFGYFVFDGEKGEEVISEDGGLNGSVVQWAMIRSVEEHDITDALFVHGGTEAGDDSAGLAEFGSNAVADLEDVRFKFHMGRVYHVQCPSQALRHQVAKSSQPIALRYSGVNSGLSPGERAVTSSPASSLARMSFSH